MNTFSVGPLSLATFGESHGPALGGVLNGIPAGHKLDIDAIQKFVDRRAPGSKGDLATSRREPDKVEWLSGLTPDSITLGTPLAFIVRNTDQRSGDYSAIASAFRTSHADYTWQARYGIRDARGGGRSSARETVSRVIAGGVALQLIHDHAPAIQFATEVLWPGDDDIRQAKHDHDTLGAIIRLTVYNVPRGLGDPVFGKISARLAEAMMSIPAAKAVEIGDGAAMARRHGSDVIDRWEALNKKSDNDIEAREDGIVVGFPPELTTATNHSGGIQGGITNGMPLVITTYFKPIATQPRPVDTVDIRGRAMTLEPRGRHDPSVAARVEPIVISMAALTILGYLLK